MPTGAFLDPAGPPTRTELQAVLGSSIDAWDALAAWVESTYGVAGEPIHFGRDSGWSIRFRRSGRSLLTLTPMADGSVRALVVIGPSAWARVADVELSAEVRSAWDAARPYPDGRWLWLPLTRAAVVEDVERLVALKSPPPRRVRPRVTASIG